MLQDLNLLLAPLLGGWLVLATHLPLGRQVLTRGIVFIDLAIAQMAGLGVLMAGQLLGHAEHPNELPGWLGPLSPLLPLLPELCGAAAALAGALLVAGLSRLWPERREALIGLLYIAAASTAVLWVSADPHGAQKLGALLSGDVLWVDWPALVPLAGASAVYLGLRRLRPGLLDSGPGFYPAFALLVSLSVPLLGLYLVFATLIVPALVAARRLPAWLAALLGAAAYALGLGLSWRLDLPAGPMVVLSLVGLAGVSLLRPAKLPA